MLVFEKVIHCLSSIYLDHTGKDASRDCGFKDPGLDEPFDFVKSQIEQLRGRFQHHLKRYVLKCEQYCRLHYSASEEE